jgi:anaerobic ribonucleoside-triphosphate reductase activating protein
MNYSKLITMDLCNGDGIRVTLYVSGCNRNCPGCFNKQTHDPNYGKPFTNDVKQLIFQQLSKCTIDGLTLLGGEPLSELSDNRKVVIELCKEVKELYPNKNIWLYSGYTIEEIQDNEDMRDILKYIDYLVDGPYIQELKDNSLKYRGSSNQRIHHIQH